MLWVGSLGWALLCDSSGFQWDHSCLKSATGPRWLRHVSHHPPGYPEHVRMGLIRVDRDKVGTSWGWGSAVSQHCFYHILSAKVSCMAGLESRGSRVYPLVQELQNCTAGSMDKERGRIVAIFIVLPYRASESQGKRRAWSEDSDPCLSHSLPSSVPILLDRPWHCQLASQFSRFRGVLASVGLPTLWPSLHSTLLHWSSFGSSFRLSLLCSETVGAPGHPQHQPRLLSLASPYPSPGYILSCSPLTISFIPAMLVPLPFLWRILHAAHPFSTWKPFPFWRSHWNIPFSTIWPPRLFLPSGICPALNYFKAKPCALWFTPFTLASLPSSIALSVMSLNLDMIAMR